MAATTTTRSGSAVRRGDAKIAVEQAAPPQASAEPASDAMQTMSRMMYSGSYALAYGIVYATVFVAQFLPQYNPVMQGFHDGGKAAMDELSHG